MRANMGLLCALLACVLACGCDKKGGGSGTGGGLPEEVPAGYPLPPGGRVTDHMTLGGTDELVVVYPGKDVGELADALRAGLHGAGWPITYDKVEGDRHFVATQHDGKNFDATVFHAPDTTISLSIKRAAKPAPTPAPAPAADSTGAGLLDGFPVPEGATRDPGYPPEPGPLAERLFVAGSRQPDDVAAWLPGAADQAGWKCHDMSGASFVCLHAGEHKQVSVRILAHPDGGTAYFLGVLPGE